MTDPNTPLDSHPEHVRKTVIPSTKCEESHLRFFGASHLRMTGKNGFTLIEVLVALTIFAFIAVGTATAVTRGLQVKKRVEEEWNKIHRIRTTLNIIRRDFYLAFHKRAEKKGFSGGSQEGWFRTFFQGKETFVNFTSLSHRRLYENTHETELCEIGYALTADPKALTQKNLTRRLEIYVDDDPERGGKTQVLLENVKELTFKYFSSEKDRWYDDWDSSHSDYRDKFPYAIEVSFILMEGEKEIPYSTKVLLAHPNNVAPKAKPRTGPGGRRRGRPRAPGRPGGGPK